MSSIGNVQSSAAVVSAAPGGSLREDVAVSVLKKAIQADGATAVALVNAATDNAPFSLTTAAEL